jgi:hypothetical protein
MWFAACMFFEIAILLGLKKVEKGACTNGEEESRRKTESGRDPVQMP